jgi:hydroxymethylpyrimidine pyrophosphatase-like HAD family hydrolase
MLWGMAGIELVVTDLDGTLWSGREETHPATVAAWRELERRGVPVLVATGGGWHRPGPRWRASASPRPPWC